MNFFNWDVMAENLTHISLAAEKVFEIGGFPVTNSLIASLIVSATLISFALFFRKKIKDSPGHTQNILELLMEWMIDLAKSVGGPEAVKFLPLVLTIFLFILMANWIGLFPGFGSVGFYQVEHGEKVFTPILRGATADLNTTFALAIISVFSIQ